jgi:hypothetical protein
MPDIVQQARADEWVARACAFGQRCGLQGVIEEADDTRGHARRTLRFEQLADAGDRELVHARLN